MRTLATPARVHVADLVAFLPALRAGARALRERERWAGRVALLPTTAEEAAEDAEAIEALVRRLDAGSPGGLS